MQMVLLANVAPLLTKGAIGVMPTDTVYGLVALASSEIAVTRLYAAKNREQKPGTLIAASIEQLLALGIDADQIDQVSRWWPNPVSAVLEIRGNDYLHQGMGSLAVRVVADDKIRTLLQSTGPLMTSSANQPGKPLATTIKEAIDHFGEQLDFYVDGGTVANVQPSTIIRPVPGGIEILRQGGVTF